MAINQNRNKIAIMAVFVVLSLIFQSTAFGSLVTDSKLNSQFTMQVGDTAEIKSELLTITLLDISDSRCPKDVTCVWEGEVTLTINVKKGGDKSKESILEIKTSQGSAISFESYSIEISNVEPYPISTEEIKKEDFVATFIVKKHKILSPLKQFKAGIPIEEVKCKENLQLLVKSTNGKPACVKPSTAIKLQDKGWGTIIKDSSMTKETIYNPVIIPSDFVPEINNKFFTLVPGTTFIYESQTEDGTERNEVNVTNNTKIVLGVQTVVVWDRVWLDNDLIEETFDWYAQDKSGNVWYFGEDSKDYMDGKITSTKGSWEAGIDGAKPGIIMQAIPTIGEPYRQEFYKGVAEDMAQVVGMDETVTVPYGTFTGCLKTKDWNSLEHGTEEHKIYCPDIGGVVLELVNEDEEKVELIDVLKELNSVG